QLGKFGAVLQEEGFDDALEGEVNADEEEVLRLRPAGDDLGLGEHRPVENEEDAEPDDLDGQLDEEVAAERQLAREPVAGQSEQQPEVTPAGLHAIPRTHYSAAAQCDTAICRARRSRPPTRVPLASLRAGPGPESCPAARLRGSRPGTGTAVP